jgi:hypothetical protein
LYDGGTADQAEADLALSHQTVSARIYELREAGCLRDSGERRQTRSGNSAVVWEHTPGVGFEAYAAWQKTKREKKQQKMSPSERAVLAAARAYRSAYAAYVFGDDDGASDRARGSTAAREALLLAARAVEG